MTTVLVERDPSSWVSGSLEINEIPHKMGIKMTSSAEMVFRHLKVREENVVGGREAAAF